MFDGKELGLKFLTCKNPVLFEHLQRPNIYLNSSNLSVISIEIFRKLIFEKIDKSLQDIKYCSVISGWIDPATTNSANTEFHNLMNHVESTNAL